jgi:predicted MFS family arabinose efflux permease
MERTTEMGSAASRRTPLGWLLPRSASRDAALVLAARALRGFGDGFVSVLLAAYLVALGFSAVQIGVIVAGTLLGSAALTLLVGLRGGSLSPRRLLLGACALMAITGLGFAGFTQFWPLLLVAFAGTLNPTAGDVSVFLPTEQALLSETVRPRERTAIFARFALLGSLAGAFGALASGLPSLLAAAQGWDVTALQRAGFVAYAGIAVLNAVLYRRLSTVPAPERAAAPQRTLERSRGIVLRLSALFSLDSFGGGFVVQSLLVLWLYKRFGLSEETTAAIFFAVGILQAFSQLASPWLAARIGLIETMVYTHLPANIFLILAALMPSAPLAVAFLLLRTGLSQMDVPARQSYVMSVVPPEERAAAASVTNVPRSLAAALPPLLAGALLARTSFGWPLIVAGVLKSIYDVLLLIQFRRIRPAE